MNNITKRGLLIVVEGLDDKSKLNVIEIIIKNLEDRKITYSYIKFQGNLIDNKIREKIMKTNIRHCLRLNTINKMHLIYYMHLTSGIKEKKF
jgi:thymidylate kinase